MTNAQLITIDDLATICGHFTESEDNNGYGCAHPESETGYCLRSNCPIATTATMEDVQALNRELWQEWGGSATDQEDTCGDWMLYDPPTLPL